MLLYRLNVNLTKGIELQEESRKAMSARCKMVCCATERFNNEIGRTGAVAVTLIASDELQMIVALKSMIPSLAEKLAGDLLAALGYEGSIASTMELTFQEFKTLVVQSYRNDMLTDDDDFLKNIGLHGADRSISRHRVTETLLNQVYTRPESERLAREMLVSESFLPELKRIFLSGGCESFRGHPVHYMVTAHGAEAALGMRELLLGALYGAGRLVGRRCCVIEFKPDASVDEEEIELIYGGLAGGTLILRISPNELNSNRADASLELLPILARLIRKYRRDVLTIFECKQQDTKMMKLFTEELFGVAVVRISEATVFRKEAKAYLRRRAQEAGTQKCAKLYALLGSGEKGFVRSELDAIFDKWYDSYLRTDLYPQYRALEKVDTARVKQMRGSAIDELNAMIGLAEPKRIISEALDFNKAQKLFADKGFTAKRPSMHMVFAGNPGSAKTTVARLFAQIMKDNGLLTVGKLIEVGRADLVGKYVGWTAQIVRDKFKSAKGSVLFIDEAYSLVEERGGLYGDEAINTIVQEMENAREDTVVIFAGYPDKMREFIERNPGLKSRIAFHVNFPDYNTDELMEIFGQMLKSNEREADQAVLSKVRGI